jgi:signal peptidase I
MDNPLPAAIRLTRRLLSVAWICALAVVVGLALWSYVAGLVIVAGGSMEPALPVGSLVNPEPVAASAIRAGDVVTVRADNGVLVTHRVVRLADLPAGRHLELQGDANAAPDPVLVPATAVVGRVDQFVPFAGYLLGMLTTLAGVVSIVALLAGVLVAIWLLEDLEESAAATTTNGPPWIREGSRAAR